MANRQDVLLLVQEILTLMVMGSDVCEDAPDPHHPRAPAEYYDALARAFVTLARIHPDPEATVRRLADALPLIENNGRSRYREVQRRLGFPADPEIEELRRLSPYERRARLAACEQEVAERKERLLRQIRCIA